MGRNMFGPIRGPWGDEKWTGWWGDNPPYHHDVFVLTHQPRESIPMEGGTTFHFVTDGIHAALDRARDAAGEQDIKIAGGVATIQQYLRAGLIDEMHLAYSPVLLGRGERLFDQLGDDPIGMTLRRAGEHRDGRARPVRPRHGLRPSAQPGSASGNPKRATCSGPPNTTIPAIPVLVTRSTPIPNARCTPSAARR